MSEPVFFKQAAGLTIGEIAALTGGEIFGEADAGFRIRDVAPIDQAGPHDLSFIDRQKYEAALQTTHAGAVLTSKRFAPRVPARLRKLVVPNAYRAFVAVATALFPQAMRPISFFETTGVAKNAQIHPSARIEAGVTIDPGAAIGPRAEIGAGTLIGPQAVIGPDVRIGRDCSIGAHVSLSYALIGDRVILHPGVRIGQDGFGFVPGAQRHAKVPQLARVIIQDDVEIGANSCVDRGSLRDTVIGEGSKLDNLVQIGHNVVIGRLCLFAGHAAIAGSVAIGDHAAFGGNCSVVDNLTIGESAFIGMGALVMTDMPAGARWGGVPARPMREWLRSSIAQRDKHDSAAREPENE